MKITKEQLSIINVILQVDKEGKSKQFGLSDLSIASDVFKEIKKLVVEDKFTDGEIELTSEQKVFITKLIDERDWTVMDADFVFALKTLIK